MWAAWIVAAIALAAAAFMLRFLIALLLEGAPSVWYWATPVRPGIETTVVETLGRGDIEDEWRGFCGQPAMDAATQSDCRAEKLDGISLQRWGLTGSPGNPIVVKVKLGRPGQSW
jgi:hypothetical protein